MLLSDKYFQEQHEFGKLATRVEIGKRVEFTKEGRSSLIPVRPVTYYLDRYSGNAFHCGLFLISFLLLGKRLFRLPRGLWPLLLSSILLYWLADVFMMWLYFPNRYVYRGLPLFVALAGGYWLSLIFARESEKKPLIDTPLVTLKASYAVCATGILIALGLFEFGDRLSPPGDLRTLRYRRHDLYDAVQNIPGRPLIAAHPTLASEIPLMSGKSVFVTREFSHPWWTDYWPVIVERTRDFFRAYYTRDPEQLKAIIKKHGIDYWIVDRSHFSPRYLRKGDYYMKPFRNWIRKQVRPSSQSLLRQVPRQHLLYRGSRYSIVSSESLMEWLDQTAGLEQEVLPLTASTR